MTGIIRELLLPIARSVVEAWSLALFTKVGNWLDANVAGRYVKLVIGMLLGLAAFFFVPVVRGILGL
ncbi:hypothetical protein C7U92_09965 [Bradyrhizobium sp. WBOS7]|uniref:Uncharacterized protein n=1 Tax=Bradyrhizobium betae TaxID=244734 RepID=A0AAE9NCU8_9BRAD|nr:MULTISPECIES: hypothetical protein [Bradyrhizobium]MDD1570435.1 hypothetical protein [Bradyrhizobium sp. WBOS1]UUO36441.1 hypothetical protein DCK84_18980 [Bradyrhizobium sp. WBOS01]MDD1526172.1 hypothetical protein [Bradyrhizobium sp. WBOS2]MDD1577055.1 hypothetical protein [Bradyrhizobium sp. WBOS7]MDD1599366.1 hypothetical protein [Bradyrhizobium sp. WBOS16]